MLPFAAQDHLKMGYCVSGNLAADAVKAYVGHMMLSATVEAAADLDVQVLHRFIQLEALLRQPLAQLARQAARGRNA